MTTLDPLDNFKDGMAQGQQFVLDSIRDFVGLEFKDTADLIIYLRHIKDLAEKELAKC